MSLYKEADLTPDIVFSLIKDIGTRAHKQMSNDLDAVLDMSDEAQKKNKWLMYGRIMQTLFQHHFGIAMSASIDTLEKVENKTQPKEE